MGSGPTSSCGSTYFGMWVAVLVKSVNLVSVALLLLRHTTCHAKRFKQLVQLFRYFHHVHTGHCSGWFCMRPIMPRLLAFVLFILRLNGMSFMYMSSCEDASCHHDLQHAKRYSRNLMNRVLGLCRRARPALWPKPPFPTEKKALTTPHGLGVCCQRTV